MDDKNLSPGRRKLLGTAAVGAAGLAVGLAGGAMAAGSQSVAVIERIDRPRFVGKVVLITGATSGIGKAAAIQFAAEGAKVAFCGRRENLGHEVEQQIRQAGGDAIYIRADVRVEKEVKAFVDRSVAHYGRLDVAFNNAGITLERPLHELTAAEWDDVVNTDLRGVFFAMKYEIPHMLAGGGGNIVVTSSSNEISTGPKRGAYTASKRGLIGLVQCAALDYAAHKIRVNALVPGTTDTALVRRVVGMENMPDAIWEVGAAQWAKSHVPGLQRMAKPEEIAAAALMLASDDHPYMTGSAFVIDGGKTVYGG
ncbi:SDR family NAD(P)-dependent oxidoreductase [Burkholderia sp. BCC1972]|uniref:SDR family NAD(P)-dependent oxidoreductase n=1 Tax=Burkholderia sp. BCC1972 TaxID=2817438 RepID=UPI002ABE87FF|nr:SDR family oxidoreductase [Burkholderia sp. BCC1972]